MREKSEIHPFMAGLAIDLLPALGPSGIGKFGFEG